MLFFDMEMEVINLFKLNLSIQKHTGWITLDGPSTYISDEPFTHADSKAGPAIGCHSL